MFVLPLNSLTQVLAPECAVKFTYLQKWLALEALPIVFATVFGLLVVVLTLGRGIKAAAQCCSRRRERVLHWFNRRERSDPVWDTIIGLYLSALYYLYFVVVNNAMAVFACSSPKPGTQPTMDSEPSVKCVDTDPEYVVLRPLAVGALVLYGAHVALLG